MRVPNEVLSIPPQKTEADVIPSISGIYSTFYGSTIFLFSAAAFLKSAYAGQSVAGCLVWRQKCRGPIEISTNSFFDDIDGGV